MSERPAVGVAIAVFKDGKVLMGRRRGSHAAGTWSFPGGHLEYGENISKCCEREVEEETGLKIKNLKFWCVTNDFFEKDKKHCVTVVFMADFNGGDLTLKEPEKCEGWIWCKWPDLPLPVMEPIQKMLDNRLDPLLPILSMNPVVIDTAR